MKSKCLSVIVVLLLVPFGVNAGEWVTADKTQCKIWSLSSASNYTVSWSGNCESGYASGSGTEICYENGKEIERYEGQIKMGKRTGKGTWTSATGVEYRREFVDHPFAITGIWTRADGYKLVWVPKNKWAVAKYEGDFVDGKFHGKGTKISVDGSKYEGDFVGGKRHGKGTIIWVDGSKYEGDFADGILHGKGTYTCINGKQFTGNFEKDRPVGFTYPCN